MNLSLFRRPLSVFRPLVKSLSSLICVGKSDGRCLSFFLQSSLSALSLSSQRIPQAPFSTQTKDEGQDNIVSPEDGEVIKHPLMDEFGRFYATGRRKTSSARVWIMDGSGQFIVNGKRSIDYFTPLAREHCIEPLLQSKQSGLFDIWCTVKGGGTSGQSGAIRLGISRALNACDPNLRQGLKSAGFLTRDSRRVERKKPGRKKARKQYQWVKR